jgi:hypothetical protein
MCTFCNCEVQAKEFLHHIDLCGSRTRQCPYCENKVLYKGNSDPSLLIFFKDYDDHEAVCLISMQNPEPIDQAASNSVSNKAGAAPGKRGPAGGIQARKQLLPKVPGGVFGRRTHMDYLDDDNPDDEDFVVNDDEEDEEQYYGIDDEESPKKSYKHENSTGPGTGHPKKEARKNFLDNLASKYGGGQDSKKEPQESRKRLIKGSSKEANEGRNKKKLNYAESDEDVEEIDEDDFSPE